MSNDDRDIQIDLDAEDGKKPAGKAAPKEPEIVIVKPDKAAAKIVEPEEGIEELKRKLAEEKTAREAAERRANDASQQVFKAKTEVDDANMNLINSAIDTVKNNLTTLEGNLAIALSQADHKSAAKVQVEISSNAAKLLQLENGKEAYAARPKQEPPKADPVEALASQLTPRSAQWVRAHPQCATDPRLTQKMIAAHNIAVADGYQPDTDDYFTSIEDTMKMTPHREVAIDDDPMEMAAKPVRDRHSSPPAAPVTRSGSAPGSNPRIVRLSSAEVEAAEASGLTPQEYYKNKMALQKENRLN
jgi:hypothetical protein